MNYLFLGSKVVLKPLLRLAPLGSVCLLTIIFTVLFGIRAITFAQSSAHHRYDDDETNYDKRQDDRMDHQDQVITGIQAERAERHAEAEANRAKQEEDHDRIVRDEAYFTGAMGFLALLQIYIKLVKRDPPHRSGVRQNDDRGNDQH